MSDLRARRRRLLAGSLLLLGAMGALMPTASLGAVKVGAVTWGLESSVPLTGVTKPTQVRFWTTRLAAGADASTTIQLSRQTELPGGHAGGAVSWTVPTHLDCQAPFDTCTLDDQGELGAYGTLHLAFQPTRPLKTTTEQCPDGVTVRRITKTRKGVLTGTLVLRTKTSVYGTIKNEAGASRRIPVQIPTVASRSTIFKCPAAAASAVATCGTGTEIAGIEDWTIHRTGTGTSRRVHAFARVSAPSLEDRVQIAVQGWMNRPARAAVLQVTDTPELLWEADSTLPTTAYLKGHTHFTEHSPLTVTSANGCTVRSRQGEITTDLVVTMPGYPSVAVHSLGGGLIAWDD